MFDQSINSTNSKSSEKEICELSHYTQRRELIDRGPP